MKHLIVFIAIFLAITTGAFAVIIQQNDFTPAENGTIPSTITTQYDHGVDSLVVPYSNVSGTSVDHTGGDGYVLSLGDKSTSGGGFNWAYPTDWAAKSTTDSVVEAWAYINLDAAAFSLERDFGLFIRATTAASLGLTSGRSGYIMWITSNSSWSSYTPPNYTPFLLKRNGSSGWVLLNEGTQVISNGWHKLKLEAIGTQIKGYVDDVEVISATDATFTNGFAGMVYYDDNGAGETPPYPFTGAFDNFLWQTPNFDVQISPTGPLTLSPGNTQGFTATSGSGNYTWSLSTTGVGSLDTTSGANVIFTAVNPGAVTLTVTDGVTNASANITVTPTSAPLAPESREPAMSIRYELFE